MRRKYGTPFAGRVARYLSIKGLLPCYPDIGGIFRPLGGFAPKPLIFRDFVCKWQVCIKSRDGLFFQSILVSIQTPPILLFLVVGVKITEGAEIVPTFSG